MRCLFWQGLVLVALLLVLQAECGKWRNTSSRKNKARKAIILCCGRKRCLDFVAKKRIFSVGTTSNATINNNNHLGISSTPKTQKVATSTSIADISATATLELTTAALDLTTSATAVETTSEVVVQETVTETARTGSVEESVGTTTKIVATEDTSTVQTTTTTSTTTTTTTTTIPKICPSPSCETHKQSILLPPLKISEVPTGKMHFHAGSFYFSSPKNVSLMEAVRSCVALNMTLLQLDLQNMPLYYNLLSELRFASVWTSGSSEGMECDVERIFSWCSSKKLFAPSDVINSLFWEKVPDGKPSAVRCLVLSALDRAFLTQTDCASDRKPFVCQPICTAGNCPTQCSKNDQLFIGNDLLKAESYGIWSEMCGATYLFGNELVTWEQNLQKCCSIGMQPIVHTTLTEQQCVAEFTKGNWSGNYNYWTGGSQGCKGLWGNCAGSTFARLSTDLIWASDQNWTLPLQENCMHLRVNRKSSGNASASAISARACTDKYVYACQSKPTVPPCTQSKCPKNCTKNKTRFSTSTGDALKPFTYGDWYTTCGRSLFFPFHNATWQDAWNFCCSFDMKLLSIEKSLTLGCITKLSIRYRSTAGVDLWTSGLGTCQKQYGWCGKKSNPELFEVNWAQGQPDQTAGDCVFARFSNSSVNESVMALGNCSQRMNFVCEKAKGTTEADTQQYECMSLYNVSKAEIDVFNSGKFNATNFPTQMKCFLKCIGDLTGLLMSGKLVMTIEMLRLIEEYSANSTQLQENFAIADECGTSGEQSECAKAAAIYQCGREKAPEVTNAIQFSISNKSALTGTLVDDILPSVPVDGRFCRMQSFPCVTNTTLRNTLSSKGSTIYGSTVTTTTGKNYFISSNFLANTRMLSDCHWICCIHGLRLAEFYSKGEADGLRPYFLNNPIDAIIEEVWVNGQQQDVWCRSQRPITDPNLYVDNLRDHTWTVSSCYYLYYSQLAVKKSDDVCGPFGKTASTACCLCM